MKAKELRIGTWYQVMTIGGYWHNRTMTVENLQSIDGCSIDVAKPIPLTEEWLKRFGFGLCEHRGYVKGEFYIGLSFNFYSDMASFKVNSVHQLQNLYFALTGEELNQNKDE